MPKTPAQPALSGAAEASAADDAEFDDDESEDRVRRVLSREIGEEMANRFLGGRRAQDAWDRARRPHEGLRERKKRITRQQISDVATALFVVRGFDHVRVSDIAAAVGVSEKTIYNYFPTKESMVFDMADEGAERLVSALRDREPGQSPTSVVLVALEHDLDHFLAATAGGADFLPAFADMIRSHPALRAAWMELHERFVAVAIDELASSLDVDPRDPEPVIAARALAGLHNISFQSLRRHIEAGHRDEELRELVMDDLRRAARVLDTGLWSLELLSQGARARGQLRESTQAAERAAAQVVAAIKQARSAWRALHGDAAEHPARSRGRQEAAQARREAVQAKREAAEAKREARRAGQEALRAARSATAAARVARGTFSDAVREPPRDGDAGTRGGARGRTGRPPAR